jgi:hypothetical protein
MLKYVPFGIRTIPNCTVKFGSSLGGGNRLYYVLLKVKISKKLLQLKIYRNVLGCKNEFKNQIHLPNALANHFRNVPHDKFLIRRLKQCPCWAELHGPFSSKSNCNADHNCQLERDPQQQCSPGIKIKDSKYQHLQL